MRMRTFIKCRPKTRASNTAFQALYICERERNPEHEEPATRPLFTHDRDGIKFRAADRYLAGGKHPKPRICDIQHIIIAFNSDDARELEKLGKARAAQAKSETSISDGGQSQERTSKFDVEGQEQIARDLPFAEAVRKMMSNFEDQTNLSDLHYAMAVHRHTSKTHVHLLLRREYTNKETGEKEQLHRLPKEFLNGLDERGRASAGLLDKSLSDALDTMIPRRERLRRSASDIEQPTKSHDTPETKEHQILSPAEDEPKPTSRFVVNKRSVTPIRSNTRRDAQPQPSLIPSQPPKDQQREPAHFQTSISARQPSLTLERQNNTQPNAASPKEKASVFDAQSAERAEQPQFLRFSSERNDLENPSQWQQEKNTSHQNSGQNLQKYSHELPQHILDQIKQRFTDRPNQQNHEPEKQKSTYGRGR